MFLQRQLLQVGTHSGLALNPMAAMATSRDSTCSTRFHKAILHSLQATLTESSPDSLEVSDKMALLVLLWKAGDSAFTCKRFDEAAEYFALASLPPVYLDEATQSNTILKAAVALLHADSPHRAWSILARIPQGHETSFLYKIIRLTIAVKREDLDEVSILRHVDDLMQSQGFEAVALLPLLEHSLKHGQLVLAVKVMTSLVKDSRHSARLSKGLDIARMEHAIAIAMNHVTADNAHSLDVAASTARLLQQRIAGAFHTPPHIILSIGKICFRLSMAAAPGVSQVLKNELREAATGLLRTIRDKSSSCWMLALLSVLRVEHELQQSLNMPIQGEALHGLLSSLYEAELALSTVTSIDEAVCQRVLLWISHLTAEIRIRMRDWDGLHRCIVSAKQIATDPLLQFSVLEPIAAMMTTSTTNLAPLKLVFFLAESILSALLSSPLSAAPEWTKIAAWIRSLVLSTELMSHSRFTAAANYGAMLAKVEEATVHLRVILDGHHHRDYPPSELQWLATRLWALGMRNLANGTARVGEKLCGQALSMANLCENADELVSQVCKTWAIAITRRF
ncbi:hypothetical protein K437DRAFT_36131 [Tilletiaria anomala UBC 951]|uniref:Protein ZIP4 homolog n=1 Tax=Tilletiaria anomala (strain ATCC 24038 / CBS 436.72 / UBC 951) TaxID=1037660 RepID=A0A066V874_TILAU|nr:uncharacterized protein K437DRAFT_36131 [Tilletiaria anomala UBC 951]KDN37686.1 hypothetical protein K437DRAFT_36131 [Tilletiaria anomala UBC 951]